MSKINLSKKAIYRTEQEYSSRMNKIRLGFNEFVPSYNENLIKMIIDSLSGELFSAYPEVTPAYDSLAKYHKISKDHFILGHGSDGVLFQTVLSLSDKNTRMLTLTPTYRMYEVYSDMIGCKFTSLEYNPNRTVDFQALQNAIHDADIFILANPNGVLGKSFSKDELDKICKLCDREKTVLIIDEAYIDFGGVSCISKVNDFDNLVVIRSFSKGFGMAGLRIGYLTTNPKLRKLILSMKPVVEINAVSAKAIPILLNDELQHKDNVSLILKSKSWFTQKLLAEGYEVLDTDTNFLLVNFGLDTDKIYSTLIAKDVEIKRLGDNFKDFLRITIATKPVMEEVIDIIRKTD